MGKLFGSTDDSSQRLQVDQNARSEEFIRQAAEQSRTDASALFPAAESNANLGFQAALDTIGQYAPQQVGAFQQGNIGAQQTLGQGSQQYENAILGNPVDRSFMQPQRINVDTGYMQQQLPQYQNTGDIMGQLNRGRQPSLFDMMQALLAAQAQQQAVKPVDDPFSNPWSSNNSGSGSPANRGSDRASGRSSGNSGRTSSGGRSNSVGGAAGNGPGGSI
jgi:hypothetical protein